MSRSPRRRGCGAIKILVEVPLLKPAVRLVVLLVGLGVAAWAFVASLGPDYSAIDAASEWARLAPLPATASDPEVQVLGSAFTRQFVITFQAPPADVQRWLQASPGPASAKTTRSGNVAVYTITPGGGAGFAEVRVNERTGQVTIRTYWS